MTDAQKFTQIDERTYIVEGKPIRFAPMPYDMDDPENRAGVIDFAMKLYGDHTLPRIYGPTTVCQLSHDGKDPKNVSVGQIPLSKLPQTSQDKIKKVMEWD